jgi:predicted acyltransferase
MTTRLQKRPIDEPILPDLQSQASTRLMSLDALRGFDMFWIIGGEELLRSIAKLSGSSRFVELAQQHTHHPEWNGFSFYDLIFPLFMFIAGVAVPFSFASHRAKGQGELALHWRVIRRGILLVLLGLIYNGLLKFNFTLHFEQASDGARQLVTDFSHVRFCSVLGRIGLGYMFAALIVLHTKPRNQFLTAIGLLLGYWAALKFIPVPGIGTGSLEPGQTVGDFIDRHLIPGRLHVGIRDPEGLFSTIPSIATVLFGVTAGHWLRRVDRAGLTKAVGLALAGAVSLACAFAWDKVFPFNKNLWTSSFVLLTSGYSLILLSIFYLIVDVWKIRGWSFFFVVIGANAITIYLGQSLIRFDELGRLVFTHDLHPVLQESTGLALKWILLWFLYRQRIFLRV